MIQLQRPTEPEEFKSKVSATEKVIQNKIKGGGKPLSVDFDDLWGSYKSEFARAQFNKCAYCEQEVVATQSGDIEHFAPKTCVTILISRGNEQAYSASVRNRKFEEVSDTGYWWLAYHWENYLLSCRICNSPWKMNAYPVSDVIPTWPPTLEKPNTSLLINPFEIDPIVHLKFTADGAIEPRNNSEMAKATIAVCGLDRLALTLRRRKLAIRVHDLAQSLIALLNEAPLDVEKLTANARMLLQVGDVTEISAGMVRAIVNEYLEVPWSRIEELAL